MPELPGSMKIVKAARDLDSNGRKVCLAIGFFDGVHLGHQQIIRQTMSDALHHEAMSLVVTFDAHPNMVVAPDRVPPLIYSLPQRLRAIESLGCDSLLLLHFDLAFSQLPAETFIRGLHSDLGSIRSLCVGSDFTFGYKRGGNVALLKAMGRELNFTVHGMSAVALDGETVSSTRIRETILAGDLDGSSQMLGRPYSLAAMVMKGDQLGRQLGFPTANLDVTGLLVPPSGVYAVHARVPAGNFRGVINVGVRPTLGKSDAPVRVEVYLMDFDGHLYGQEMEVTFVDKLRDERTFGSLDALREQIANDVKEALKRF